MVTIDTVRVVNESPTARRALVRTMITCSQGALPASPYTELQATGATGGNERVQWYPYGERYSDGSAQFAVVQFHCDLTANQVRSVVIETGSVTPVAWKLHDAWAAILSGIQFRLYVKAFASRHSTPNDVDYTTINLDRLRDALLRTDETTEVLDGEFDDISNTRVRTFRIREQGSGGGNFANYGEEWWAELELEVPRDQRQIRFELTYGVGLLRPDSNTTYPYQCHELLKTGNGGWGGDGIELEIGHNSLVGAVTHVIRCSELKVKDTGVFGGLTVRKLVDPNRDINPGRGHLLLAGFSQVIEGVILCNYTTPAITPDEANTILAEQQGEVWACSQTWATKNNFLAFGYVPPRPTNAVITSDADARTQANLLDASLYSTQISDPSRVGDWVALPVLGPLLSANPTGSHPDYGALKLWPWIVAGWPVCKAAKYGCYQTASMVHHLREFADLGPLRPEVYHKATTARAFDLVFKAGGLWGGNTMTLVPDPPDADMGGKREHRIFHYQQTRSGWDILFQDREHGTANVITAFALFTANRWALKECGIYATVQRLTCQYPSLGGTRPFFHGDTYDAGRDIGRNAQAMANLYTVTGDVLLKEHMLNRIVELFTPGNYLDTPKVKCSEWASGPGSPPSCNSTVERSNVPNTDVYYPWHDGTMIGLYAIWRKTGNATIFSRFKDIIRAHHMYSWANRDGHNPQPYVGTVPTRCHPTVPYTEFPERGGGDLGWMTYKSALVQPPGTEYGDGPQAHQLNSINIVDFGDFSYRVFPGTITTALIGWELASLDNDQEWKARCKAIIDSVVPLSVNDPERQGLYGFGRYPNFNLTEWLAVVDNPYKARLLDTSELSAELDGSGDLDAVITTANRHIEDNGGPVVLDGNGDLAAIFTIVGGGTNFVDIIDAGPDSSGLVLTGEGDLVATLDIVPLRLIFDLDVTFGTIPVNMDGSGDLAGTLSMQENFAELVAVLDGEGELNAGLSRVLDTRKLVSLVAQIEDFFSFEINLDKPNVKRIHFEMFAGDDVTIEVTVKRGRIPVDLSNVEKLSFVLGTNPVLVNKTLANNGINLSDPAAGKFQIILNAPDTHGQSGDQVVEAAMRLDDKETTLFTGVGSLVATAID